MPSALTVRVRGRRPRRELVPLRRQLQWSWQRDFFDFGNATSLFIEMMRAGVLQRRNAAQARPGERQRGVARALSGRRAPVGLWD